MSQSNQWQVTNRRQKVDPLISNSSHIYQQLFNETRCAFLVMPQFESMKLINEWLIFVDWKYESITQSILYKNIFTQGQVAYQDSSKNTCI